MAAAKKDNGRPKYEPTNDEVRQIEGLAAVLTAEQIASFLGISRSTFFLRLKDTPVLAEAVERGKGAGVARIANSLMKKALNGDTTAMIFYLKCKGGWRESRDLTLSAPGGGPVQVEDRNIDETKLSLDQKRALLAAVVSDDDQADEG